MLVTVKLYAHVSLDVVYADLISYGFVRRAVAPSRFPPTLCLSVWNIALCREGS